MPRSRPPAGAGRTADSVRQLVAELESTPGLPDGDRPFAGRLKREQAADVADFAHAEIARAEAERDRAAAERGVALACTPGCAFCCEELILCAAPEIAAVGRWLAQDVQREARRRFLDAYPAWRAAVGEVPEQLAALTAAGDYQGQQRLYLAHYRRRVSCPLNHEGLCLIYPVRPIGCHHAHAVGTPDHCRADHPSGRAPERFPFAPFDQAIDRGHRLMRAAHHAMGAPRGTPRALCVALHERFAGPAQAPAPVGRNDPCPCGSGHKYKRCCGR